MGPIELFGFNTGQMVMGTLDTFKELGGDLSCAREMPAERVLNVTTGN